MATPALFDATECVLERGRSAAPKRLIRWDDRASRTYPHGDFVQVWINVHKLELMLPLARIMEHVGFAGKNGIRGKYTGVDNFIRSPEFRKLSMPGVKIERACEKHPDQDVVYIFNGRHRFAWMRDHGAEALPVAALRNEASEVDWLIGTKDRICRVTMRKIPEWHPDYSQRPASAA